MYRIASLFALIGISKTVATSSGISPNSTYYNPILPGWHSDPSCINVNNTFYCATSFFQSFPGLPIYASKDLTNWKHVSNAWNRKDQLPGINLESPGQQGGMFAPKLRYHDGLFYRRTSTSASTHPPRSTAPSSPPQTRTTTPPGQYLSSGKIHPVPSTRTSSGMTTGQPS